MTYTLVLLRHGHSEWNAKNLFTGWVDVDLNEQGVEEAHRGADLLTDDDFRALQADLERAAAAPLASVRRVAGEQRNQRTDDWIRAGDRLAEKAIAALDTGDDARAAALVHRIVALPIVDESIRSGLMAVGVLLVGEILEPLDEQRAPGLLDAPLRLLPTLEPVVADELRRALAALLDRDLPTAVERRIRDVVDPGTRLKPPFAGVPEDALPAAVTGVLQLVLRLRAD